MYENREIIPTSSVKFPFVYMLVGLPASGKSTFRNKHYLPFTSSDYYIEKWAAESGRTYEDIFLEVVDKATKRVNEDVDWFNSNNNAWIWDQTNLTPSIRQKKLAKIDPKFRKIAVHFDTPLEVCLVRNAARDRILREHIIENMARTLTKPTLEEGFDEVWTYDQDGQLVNIIERVN